jgi:hypothetical protein
MSPQETIEQAKQDIEQARAELEQLRGQFGVTTSETKIYAVKALQRRIDKAESRQLAALVTLAGF